MESIHPERSLSTMIDLLVLKPDVIYNFGPSKYLLTTESHDPMHGSVYVSVTKTMSSTAMFFSKPVFLTKYLTHYYHERIFNYRIYNQVFRYRIQDKDLTDMFDLNIVPKLPHLKLSLTKEVLNKNNYIYDISELNQKFFTLQDSRVRMKRIDEYFRLFKLFLNNIDSQIYQNKILFIPIDEWVTNVQNQRLYNINTTDNFLSMFYHKLTSDYSYFKTLLSDWKVYFINVNKIFTIDFSNLTEKSSAEFKDLLYKMHAATPTKNVVVNDNVLLADDAPTIEAINRTKIKLKIEDNLSSPDTPLTNDTITQLIDKTIDKSDIDIYNSDLQVTDSDIISKKESELLQIAALKEKTIPRSSARLAREKHLLDNMKNLIVKDESIGEILARVKKNTIPEVDIPVDTINPNLKKMTFPEFDKAYMDNLYKSDIVRIMSGLQYKDRPLYLIETSVTDVSNKLNEVEEYTFKFEDEHGGRHTFQVLLPKMIDNRFMKLGGNKKIMIYQSLPLPVTKTAPDTVQVASNYKKTFITRFGQNISPKVSVLFKSLAELYSTKVTLMLGASARDDAKYMTTIEYDEISSKYRQIILPSMTFYFDQTLLNHWIKKLNIKLSQSKILLPLAITKENKVVYLDTTTGLVDNKNIIDYIVAKITEVEPTFDKPFKSIKFGRKYMYNRAAIMDKKVPLIILLAYLDGLFTVMKKADIKYRIIDKATLRGSPMLDSGNEDVIEFQDAYLVYEIYPLRNSLLMSGFSVIPTRVYDISQFIAKDIYYEIFDVLFGRKNIGYAFENFQQLFTDPMTEDVLRDYNLPTDFVELLLYANGLLEDNSFNDEGDENINRIRSNEMVAAFLYRVVASAYENYRLTADNPHPAKFGTKKDAVLIEILTNQVTQDFSLLSPLQCIETMRAVTYKGPGGLNQDRAFSLSKRSFHSTMLGIISQASPISGSIGVTRTLTVDANVTSARGYMKTTTDVEEIRKLPSTKLLSGSEAISPFSASSDEPEREAMLSAQAKHTIACIDNDVSPLGTGFEKALPYLIGNNFVAKSASDGMILRIDAKNNVIIVKYDDGRIETVNLNPVMGKNSGSGFYVANSLKANVAAGDKIKANMIIAYNPDYFKKDKRTGILSLSYGPLARVALRYSSKTLEDSGGMSKRLSTKMSSYIIDKKDVALGKNSNIDYIVKKGQTVKVGDPLIIFDTSHDDDLTNKILARLNDNNIKELIDASKTPIASKRNGVIDDIKIFYTVSKEELSESARKIIENFELDNTKRVSQIAKETGLKPKDINISLIDIERVEPDSTGKVKGVKVGDGILIEFYIRYKATMGVGDKLSTSSAVKSVICDVWEDGKEPYLLSDPTDKVDLYVGVLSIGARLTHAFPKVIQLNGILIGMKKHIKHLYEEIYGEKLD